MKTEAKPVSENLCFNYTSIMVKTQNIYVSEYNKPSLKRYRIEILVQVSIRHFASRMQAFIFWSLPLRKKRLPQNYRTRNLRPSSQKAPILLIIVIALAFTFTSILSPVIQFTLCSTITKNAYFSLCYSGSGKPVAMIDATYFAEFKLFFSIKDF